MRGFLRFVFYGWSLLLIGFLHAAEADQASVWTDLGKLGVSLDEAEISELFSVYATSEGAKEWLRVENGTVSVHGRKEALSALKTSIEKLALELPPAIGAKAEGILAGWRIALDPGHLGGEWGPLEARSFRIGEGAVAQEGDLVLATAKYLKASLEGAGAEVLLLREKVGPVTDLRPQDFLGPSDEVPRASSEAEAKRFFLREDIRARGQLLEGWGAHLVLALHINASSWPDPDKYDLLEANHGHILVNGAYLDNEVGDETQRFEMLGRWLVGYHEIELEIATAMAESMAEATGLEPYAYSGDNAVRVNENPYVWARNLMASRLYPAPVVYLEPWVLNSAEVYPWGSLGDYEGTRMIDGLERVSLPRVYADFALEGLLRFVNGRSQTVEMSKP